MGVQSVKQLQVFSGFFTGTFQSAGVIQAAYELNCPLQVHSLEVPSDVTSRKFVTIDTPSVILETLKKVFVF